MKRFRRIKNEFGVEAYLRTSVLLIGLGALVLFDYFGFSSIRAGLIALIGLTLGWLFRRKIPEGADYYSRATPAGLAIYSITLLLGGLLGLERSAELGIITATTVVIFDLQFWSLSDPSVVNGERET